METCMTTPALQGDCAEVEEAMGEYAGFWLRFVAYLIDGMILGGAIVVICGLLFLVFYSVIREMPRHLDPSDRWELWPFIIVVYAVECLCLSGCWLYYAMMESGPHQATVGKRAMGLIVTDADGYPINFGRATGRFFAKALSGMTLAIGYIMADFTPKKQALHDMVANTLVLRYDLKAAEQPQSNTNQ